MFSVVFKIQKIGEVCGMISLPDKNGTFRYYDVIPMSLINTNFGYTEVRLIRDDRAEGIDVVGTYNHTSGQIQAYFPEEYDNMLCVSLKSY